MDGVKAGHAKALAAALAGMILFVFLAHLAGRQRPSRSTRNLLRARVAILFYHRYAVADVKIGLQRGQAAAGRAVL